MMELMEPPRPPIILSYAMPVWLRFASYALGFGIGAVVGLALGLLIVGPAILGGTLVAFSTDIWWRQTHWPAEDGPYAFYTKERRLQKTREERASCRPRPGTSRAA
jgi:hypothetical protein